MVTLKKYDVLDPPFFHLCTPFVLYLKFSDQKKQISQSKSAHSWPLFLSSLHFAISRALVNIWYLIINFLRGIVCRSTENWELAEAGLFAFPNALWLPWCPHRWISISCFQEIIKPKDDKDKESSWSSIKWKAPFAVCPLRKRFNVVSSIRLNLKSSSIKYTISNKAHKQTDYI